MTEADDRWHRDLFKQVIVAAKVPAFSPYDLRHTFASILPANNVPLHYVSKQLGHAKAITTLDH
ncbi:tyrosine-type recombinase/integrase [Petrachloros mirabilis]